MEEKTEEEPKKIVANMIPIEEHLNIDAVEENFNEIFKKVNHLYLWGEEVKKFWEETLTNFQILNQNIELINERFIKIEDRVKKFEDKQKIGGKNKNGKSKR